ncbi:MAG: hypothetical protein ACOCM8_02460 [Acetivibrio ethanolgignens]
MIQPVYNYLLVSYMPKSQASNRTHKPSELRSLYSHMVKLNQKSPLYKINLSMDTQVFALSLKEASMALNQVMTDLNAAFSYTKAVSDQPESAEAVILKDDLASLPDSFQLQVHSLATSQVNTTSFVPSVLLSKAPVGGSYSFTIEVEDSTYEFQFNIKEYSKNQDILTKLSDFINKSQVGVKASILQEKDTVALRLESEDTGDVGEPIFTVRDTASPTGAPGLAAFYHMNNITFPAVNASYSINGVEHSGLTNSFILNRSLQIDLKEVSDNPVFIGYGPDTDKILSRLEQFKDTFNYTLQLARSFGAKQPTANRVINELKAAVVPYLSELEAAGFSFADDGSLQIDTALAADAIGSHEMEEIFSIEKGLIHNLINKTNYITINPMDYVDKVLVTYPNLSKPAAFHPYASSIYSGLLFNYYC